MNSTHIEQAKQRILSINWKSDDSKEGSHRLLFDEFLRRAALVAEAVDLLKDPSAGWLLYDYATFFDSSLEIENESIEMLAAELQVNGYPFWYSSRVCVYFIHWVTIQDYLDVIRNNLLNPYEPLVMLYERGGTFRRDKDGTWEFASTAFFISPASSYLNSTPVVALNEALLSQADEEFKVLLTT